MKKYLAVGIISSLVTSSWAGDQSTHAKFDPEASHTASDTTNVMLLHHKDGPVEAISIIDKGISNTVIQHKDGSIETRLSKSK